MRCTSGGASRTVCHAIRQSYEDCEDLCAGLSGQAWIDCMQGCFQVLCEEGHEEFCDP